MKNMASLQKALLPTTLLIAALGFSPTYSAKAAITIDFDTGTPTKSPGDSLPFDQTSGGVTATFSSPQQTLTYFPFSVQQDQPPARVLSQFSGNYLWSNHDTPLDTLLIEFDQQLGSITLGFALKDPDVHINQIRLTAFLGGTTQVGTPVDFYADIQGPSDTNPQGTIVFGSGGQAFDSVLLAMVPSPNAPVGFFVDNIDVTAVPEPVNGALVMGGSLFLFVLLRRVNWRWVGRRPAADAERSA